MSMLTEKGFVRGTYAEYLTVLESRAKELFGSDVDLGEKSPIGQLVRMLAYEKIERDDLAEQVYNANSVDNAEGIILDNQVKAKGITRFGNLAASGEVRFHVETGAVISAGVLVGIPNTDITYYVTETTADLDGDGYITARVEATEQGAIGNAAPNTITDVVTPIPGVNGVTNIEPFTNGKDKETDAELRNRYYSTTGSGSSAEGLRSILMNEVEGVRSAIVVENNTNEVDADGRPPNSFEAVVLGGSSQDIAQTILLNKPAGIRPYGQESHIITDTSGLDRLIEFSYAVPVTIYARITIKTNPSFPSNGENVIKLKTTEYIGGTYKTNSYTGLGMGNDIIIGRHASLLFSMQGVDDVTISYSTDGENYNVGNVEIPYNKVAEVTEERVEVIIV